MPFKQFVAVAGRRLTDVRDDEVQMLGWYVVVGLDD